MLAPQFGRLKIPSTKCLGDPFPAEHLQPAPKPAGPNRRRVTIFLSVFLKENTHSSRNKIAPLWPISTAFRALCASARQALVRTVYVSREIGSRDFADKIWRLKPWHKHLDM